MVSLDRRDGPALLRTGVGCGRPGQGVELVRLVLGGVREYGLVRAPALLVVGIGRRARLVRILERAG